MRSFSAESSRRSRVLNRWWERLTGRVPSPATVEVRASEPSLGRKAPCDVDRILLSTTHLWLRTIPSSLLPKHLCHHHPHLANRFAQVWGDREWMAAMIDELLIDRRGGRRGLSARVRLEIEQLERFHTRWLADPRGTQTAIVSRRRRVRSAVVFC